MDAVGWTSRDDIYSSFFEAVGAPPWHGKNLDAIWDSIRGGQINKIEVPFRLVFTNYAALSPSLKNDAERFIGVFRDAAEDAVPVDIRIEP
jgi:RNAse (barnase) inhibitor barstar